MGAASRRKGRQWESQLAAWLKDNGFPHAEMRSVGMAGSPDITGIPCWTIEAKNRKRDGMATALAEGIDQATHANRGPSLPVCIVKRPGKPDPADAYAVMTLRDWTRLARHWDGWESR